MELAVVGGKSKKGREKITRYHPTKQRQKTIKVIFNIEHKL